MNTISEIIYEYKLKSIQIFNVISGLVLIGAAIFLYFRFGVDEILAIIIAFFFILGSIRLIISFAFYRIFKDSKIVINSIKNIVTISQQDKRKTFNIESIIEVEIHDGKGLGNLQFDFAYVKYKLENGKYFIVSMDMADIYFVPEHIDPTNKTEFLPMIWRASNLFEG